MLPLPRWCDERLVTPGRGCQARLAPYPMRRGEQRCTRNTGVSAVNIRTIRLQPWKLWLLAAVGVAVALAFAIVAASLLVILVPVVLLGGLVAKSCWGVLRPCAAHRRLGMGLSRATTRSLTKAAIVGVASPPARLAQAVLPHQVVEGWPAHAQSLAATVRLPPLWASARRRIERTRSSRRRRRFRSAAGSDPGSSRLRAVTLGPAAMMTARFTRFCSSRMLPGQDSYRSPPARRRRSPCRRGSAPGILGQEDVGHAAPRRRRARAAAADARDLGQPVVQVLPELPSRISSSRSRWVAQTTRTSTGISLRPPIRSITRSCRKRSSLACSASGRSPISSRNSVPPLACSIRPAVCLTAPVKAPRSWPNSSALEQVLGDGRAVDGDERRPGAGWRRAAPGPASLPVPLSPPMITLTLVGATRPI